MSTPDEAVQQQLAAQAADLGGAGQAVPAINLAGAQASVVDAQQLLARLQELEAKAAAAEAAANPPPAPPDNSIVADSNAPAWLHRALGNVETRLAALEAHAGL